MAKKLKEVAENSK